MEALEFLTSRAGIVVDVEKDEQGMVIGYSMFHARNPRSPASTTQHFRVHNNRTMGLPPFGNWKQQWVAIAYPLGKPVGI